QDKAQPPPIRAAPPVLPPALRREMEDAPELLVPTVPANVLDEPGMSDSAPAGVSDSDGHSSKTAVMTAYSPALQKAMQDAAAKKDRPHGSSTCEIEAVPEYAPGLDTIPTDVPTKPDPSKEPASQEMHPEAPMQSHPGGAGIQKRKVRVRQPQESASKAGRFAFLGAYAAAVAFTAYFLLPHGLDYLERRPAQGTQPQQQVQMENAGPAQEKPAPIISCSAELKKWAVSVELKDEMYRPAFMESVMRWADKRMGHYAYNPSAMTAVLERNRAKLIIRVDGEPFNPVAGQKDKPDE
ncbi:MAG: hypothetical protein ACP5NX_03800, partial [Candidatus Bilamarchaeaceae archaeon]